MFISTDVIIAVLCVIVGLLLWAIIATYNARRFRYDAQYWESWYFDAIDNAASWRDRAINYDIAWRGETGSAVKFETPEKPVIMATLPGMELSRLGNGRKYTPAFDSDGIAMYTPVVESENAKNGDSGKNAPKSNKKSKNAKNNDSGKSKTDVGAFESTDSDNEVYSKVAKLTESGESLSDDHIRLVDIWIKQDKTPDYKVYAERIDKKRA